MSISLSVLVNRYLNRLRRDGKSVRTLAAYATDLKQLTAILDDESINLITSDKLSVDLASHLKPLAQSSQVRKLTTTKEFLLWAFQAGYLTQEITPSIKISRNITRRDVGPLSASQLSRLRRVATISERVLIELLLQTGMKLSDACALKNKHLTSKFIIHPTQGIKISITQPLRKALANYRQIRYISYISPKGSVLMNQFNRPLSTRSATSALAFLAHRAGVRHATPKNLRATFIVHQLAQGTSPMDIQRILGFETLAPLAPYLASAAGTAGNTIITLAQV